MEQVGDFSTKNVNGQIEKTGGNVATYLCTPSGRVVHAVLGPVSPRELRTEIRWALYAYEPVRYEEARFRIRHMQDMHAQRSTICEKTREQRLATYLTEHPMEYLDRIYQHVFTNILGEKLSQSGLTVAQAAEKIERAKKTGRPLLFVIHDESQTELERKWKTMSRESLKFDRHFRKQLADYIMIPVREDQQAALSQQTNRPPFESPTGSWPLFVIATSECEQVDAFSGSWCTRSLAKSLATNWIDSIGDRRLTPLQVKAARVVHGRLGNIPVEKFNRLEIAAELRSNAN